MPERIKVGTQFRAGYADSNALWEVKSSRGRGAWNCEIVNEKMVVDGKEYDGDYVGVKKVFGTEEIQRAVGLSKLFDNLHKRSDDFYASLREGQVVHYQNTHGVYVRCKVVKKDGENVLKPVALVGEWRGYDLPHRYPDGKVAKGYYPEMIEKGETFHPHDSNIVESPGYASRREVKAEDVAKLPEIDLTVPAPTKQEQDTAAAWEWKRQVQAELEKVVDQQTLAGFKAFLKPLLEG